MRAFVFLLLVVDCCPAQQVGDTSFTYPISRPQYAAGKGPEVVIDEAHRNFHTASGRYYPFAKLLRADGYRVSAGTKSFAESLPAKDAILVIANATDGRQWILPTHSAFTVAEIEAVITWVRAGGSLLLIADHMPMAGAADSLARAFGFRFYNGFAVRRDNAASELFCRADGNLLANTITNGFGIDEQVDSVIAFTGQGFSIPEGAIPVMRLGKEYEVLLPDTAWRFHDNTPRVPGDDLFIAACLEFGKGRIAVFGEAAMFTAQTVSGRKVGMNHPVARNNAQLLRNVMRWLGG